MIEKVIVKTAPTVEPISLNEARRQLRLDPGDDDDFLDIIIPKARDAVENFCNRFFTSQVVELVIEPGDSLTVNLGYPDLVSVDSFKYYDEDFTETTLGVSEYTFLSAFNAVRLDSSVVAYRYVVEVTTGAPVEFEGAKTAMLLMLNDLYEMRGTQVVGVSVTDNKSAVLHAWPYRVQLGV